MRLNSGLTLFMLLVFGSSPAHADEASGDWRQTIFLYGMAASIGGDAQIGPLEVSVSQSISDVFDALRFGAMGAYRIENNAWSFTGDLTYMDLRSERTSQQGNASAVLDTEQFTAMLTAGRRIAPRLEALVSLAYFDVDADLSVRVMQQSRTASRDVDWVDPLLGLSYESPLGSRWRFTLRGDIGGFGVGSDLTWHGLMKFTFQQSDRLSWYFGYRAIAYDYEEGAGLEYLRYDLVQHGPGAGVAFSF